MIWKSQNVMKSFQTQALGVRRKADHKRIYRECSPKYDVSLRFDKGPCFGRCRPRNNDGGFERSERQQRPSTAKHGWDDAGTAWQRTVRTGKTPDLREYGVRSLGVSIGSVLATHLRYRSVIRRAEKNVSRSFFDTTLPGNVAMADSLFLVS